MGVPFHPTIGSEEFTLSTLATPVPSHDITRESMPFLRDPLSITTTLRGLSDASSASSSWSSTSGHVFSNFLAGEPRPSCLVSLLLSAEPHACPPLPLSLYSLHPFRMVLPPILFLLSEGNSRSAWSARPCGTSG
jgi:hypothetical protein